MKSNSTKINLLIVDDEKDFLEASAQALVRRGFLVETALDGATALAMIAEQVFDAVLLDIKMPGLDGVEVFQHIKRMSPNLPVVMLTGHGNIQQAFDTSKDGVFRYLTKPCSVEKIVETVQAAVNFAKKHENALDNSVTETIRLLLVEDDPVYHQLLCKFLRRRNFEISTASNIEEAFRLLDRLYFDVALIDIETSEERIVALVKYIKQLNTLSEIIYLVPSSSTTSKTDEIGAYLFEVLVKPINTDLIERKITDAYRRRKQNQKDQQKENIREILERNTD